MVERVEQKLATWKAKYLSIGGRITLIKAAHANLPNYFMSIFRCPSSVVNRIGKLHCDFFMAGKETKKKYHLVEWKKVCTPKIEGGLGLRLLRLINNALLGKWFWRIGDATNNL